MPGPTDFSSHWSDVSRKLDQMADKIDVLQQQQIDLWQKHHDEVDKLKRDLRTVETNHGERITAHATELTVWRWALLICLGMIITAVMQFSISHYQGVLGRSVEPVQRDR